MSVYHMQIEVWTVGSNKSTIGNKKKIEIVHYFPFWQEHPNVPFHHPASDLFVKSTPVFLVILIFFSFQQSHKNRTSLYFLMQDSL